jgi:hypothetical protein
MFLQQLLFLYIIYKLNYQCEYEFLTQICYINMLKAKTKI